MILQDYNGNLLEQMLGNVFMSYVNNMLCMRVFAVESLDVLNITSPKERKREKEIF